MQYVGLGLLRIDVIFVCKDGADAVSLTGAIKIAEDDK